MCFGMYYIIVENLEPKISEAQASQASATVS